MTESIDRRAARVAARIANKEAKARAKAAFDALPASERWANFERMGMLLNQQQWIFAKTMAHNPHWYTLRRKWKVEADFPWTVAELRAHGYRSKFQKTWYTQVDVNDHFYWTMGAEINYPNGMAHTVLINRKPLAALEGRVAPHYPSTHRGEEWFTDALSQNATVLEILDDVAGLDILDVGCGPGGALDHLRGPFSYTGIDPSQVMLDRLGSRHPDAHTVCTTLRSFVPLTPNGDLGRFDVVLVLSGTGSYLSDEELERVPLLLRPGGRAIVTFCDHDEFPRSPAEDLLGVVPRKWVDGLFPGEITTVGHQIVCIYDKK